MMFAKTLLSAAVAATALTSLSATAQEFSPTGFDACNPEAWDMFGYAVENRDYDLLAQMMNDAEFKVCEFYATAELLYCQQNPQDCFPPAGGPDPQDDPGDDPQDDPGDDPQDDPNDRPDDPLGPGAGPGSSIGTENDDGDDGDDGGNDPGNDPSNDPGNDPGGNDNGRDPTNGNSISTSDF